MSDVRYWLWLSLKLAPGSAVIDQILQHFSYDAKEVFKASQKELERVPGLKDEQIDVLLDKSLDETKDIYSWCMTQNVGLLAYDSPLYPERLRSIPHPPLLLYYKGKLPDFDKYLCIATVGTRRITEYGKREGYMISRDLALAGAIVVSGMARGIDSVCHRGALDASGHTIAVLGCGINRIYPPENGPLMDEIILSGTVMTEYKPDTPPIGSNFPIRNRIISGLCQGTLVVEADEKSGAMITARTAGQQGRDLFALPGKVDEMNSQGTNALIQDGAKMVTSARDILVEYEFYYPTTIRTDNLPAFLPRFIINPFQRQKVNKATKILSKQADADSSKDGKSHLPEVTVSSPVTATIKPTASKKKGKKVVLPEITPLDDDDELLPREDPPISLTDDPAEIPAFIGKIQADVLRLMPVGEKISADDIAKKGAEVSTVLSALTMLEVGGLVRSLPGGLYERLK